MKETNDIVVCQRSLKWLMKAILVFGLITFSGQLSAERLFSLELPKTELREVRTVKIQRSVHFNETFAELNSPPSVEQEVNFYLILLHQENVVEIKLKRNCQKFSFNKFNYTILIVYSTDDSTDSTSHPLRG